MAHFAKITDDNQVLEVQVVDDTNCQNSEGVETESIGQQYLETHCNWPANQWIQTSYNTHENQHTLGGTPFRGNYAAVGYIWDSSKNIFYPPKPYNSWVFDDTQAVWQSPIGAAPSITAEQQEQNNAGTHFWAYDWDEENQTWNLINTYA